MNKKKTRRVHKYSTLKIHFLHYYCSGKRVKDKKNGATSDHTHSHTFVDWLSWNLCWKKEKKEKNRQRYKCHLTNMNICVDFRCVFYYCVFAFEVCELWGQRQANNIHFEKPFLSMPFRILCFSVCFDVLDNKYFIVNLKRTTRIFNLTIFPSAFMCMLSAFDVFVPVCARFYSTYRTAYSVHNLLFTNSFISFLVVVVVFLSFCSTFTPP